MASDKSALICYFALSALTTSAILPIASGQALKLKAVLARADNHKVKPRITARSVEEPTV